MPGTGTSDCNDADVSVRPARPELRSRRLELFVGGGVDLAEDRDGDGHASPGAACTGGYPKDDCNDSDAAIHGASRRFAMASTTIARGRPTKARPASRAARASCALATLTLICRSALSWTAADTSCARMGMRLVRVDDATEDAWVRGRIPSTEEIWLGGSDVTTEGRWVWTDGVQFWQGGSGGTRLSTRTGPVGSPTTTATRITSSCAPTGVGAIRIRQLEPESLRLRGLLSRSAGRADSCSTRCDRQAGSPHRRASLANCRVDEPVRPLKRSRRAW
ncbi:MAG: hypothetical protein H6720_02290 [Sandaracinus sp.]|nr:hypothetical protein [Sandaracinus sp.]